MCNVRTQEKKKWGNRKEKVMTMHCIAQQPNGAARARRLALHAQLVPRAKNCTQFRRGAAQHGANLPALASLFFAPTQARLLLQCLVKVYILLTWAKVIFRVEIFNLFLVFRAAGFIPYSQVNAILEYQKPSSAGLVLEFEMWRHFDTKQKSKPFTLCHCVCSKVRQVLKLSMKKIHSMNFFLMAVFGFVYAITAFLFSKLYNRTKSLLYNGRVADE